MSALSATRLQGDVALITGGLRGIGLAIAERFIAEGAEVVLTDLETPADARTRQVMDRLGQAASYLQANVTSETDWDSVRSAVSERHGRLHILVNNAGVDLSGPFEDTTLEAWRKIMAVNVDGVFLGCRTLLPLLVQGGKNRKGGSSIINVSSIMGLVGMSEVSAYNTTKGAVRLFTKGIAIEFAQKKTPVRVNSLHPGFVMTPLLQAGFQRWVEKGAADKPEDLIAQMEGATPIGRLADPSELAGGAFFLASEDSSFMTGAELVMDGGWTAQ
jgi:NAD(P)-dependent dehydrogenase (short-subunit alcohol dehydrogenase family)